MSIFKHKTFGNRPIGGSLRHVLLAGASGTAVLAANAAFAVTPINTAEPYYLESQIGVTVSPDFQGGTLRDDRNNVTDSSNFSVENFSTNTIDAFGHTTTFSGTFSGAGPLTITDSVGGGDVIVTNFSSVSGAVTIDSGATLQWGNGTTPGYLFGFSGAGNVVNNGTLVVDEGGSGIGNFLIAGSGNLVMESGGMSLQSASTYTGTTTIDSGATIFIQNAGSISDSSNVIDGGTFDISATTTGTSVTTLSGSGTVNLGSKTLTLTDGSTVFSGSIGGTGGNLTISGGTQTLSGTSSYTGVTTIDSGATLQLGNGGTTGSVSGNITDNGSLLFDYSGSVTTPGQISGTGSATVLAGTAVVTNFSSVSGAVTIDSGATLQWGNGTTPGYLFGFSGAGNVVNNGTLVVDEGGSGIGNFLIAGSGNLVMESGGMSLQSASTYTGTTTIDSGATIFIQNAGSISDSSNVIDNGTFDISSTTAGTSITTLSGSGTVDLGGQTLTLTNASGTFSGAFSNSGITSGSNGGVTIAGGTEIVTGTSIVGGTVTIDNGATLQWGNGGGAYLMGFGSVSGSAGVVDNGTLVTDFGGSGVGGTTIIGSGNVVLEGDSGLTLYNASTYTGTTTIDAGSTLFLSHSGGSSGSISDSSNVIDLGTLDITGTTAGTSITTLSGSGTVSLGSKTLTITDGSTTFSGTIQDAGIFPGSGGNLTIAGGTQILTGTNTFTGTTTINSGATLQLGNGGSTGSVAGNITDNGALKFDYSGSVVTAGTISGSGNAEVVAGTAVVTGASIISGTVTIDNGATLQWGNGNGAYLMGFGSFSGSAGVVDNGTLVTDFGGSGVGGTTISGSGNVVLESNSGLTLYNASTYTGTTTIDAGSTLFLSHSGGSSGSIADSSNVIDAGTLDITGTTAGTSIITLSGSGTVSLGSKTLTITDGSTTFSGTIQDAGIFPGSGGNLTIAGGTETLTGANTFTGTTTIDNGGVLLISNAGSIADSTNIIDSGTFDISGTTAGTSITTLSGSGTVSLGNKTLTISDGSTTFSGVLKDGGISAPSATGGSLTIAGGTEILTGTNTYTGTTTINTGATLQLGGGGTTGSVAGNITDNGALKFDYSGSVVTPGTISGTGNVEAVAGTTVITGASVVGGTVTIDSGATMQWGNGSAAFLVGGSNGVTDNGSLVTDFGGGGVGGAFVFSGTGSLTVQSGALNTSGVSTYTGTTTVDSGAFLLVSDTGSIADSSNIIDKGTFDISGTTAGTSITTLSGSGTVALGSQTLTITDGSTTFSGVLKDGGISAPSATGGSLTIAGGTETLTGTNTYTGTTTINTGATLQLGSGGTTGSVAGNITDNGLVKFDYSGSVLAPNTFSGTGNVEAVAGTTVITGASVVGGTVTIDSGATMQWGNGSAAFLVGGSNGVTDNGSLVTDFGGGGVGGAFVFSGTGSLTVQTGSLNIGGLSTYSGTTTIDSGAFLLVSDTGSISNSSNIIDSGTFDISNTTTGASITTLSGNGAVNLGSKVLTITAGSTDFSGALKDGGIGNPSATGGSVVIAGGTQIFSGTNTYTGTTTINTGATLQLGAAGTTGSVAGNITDNGLVKFDYSGSVLAPNTFSGTGNVEAVAGTTVITGASVVGGTVTIDSGATMQWGNGSAAFLVGGSNGVTDNGSLVTDFGGGGVGGAFVFSGTGSLTVQTGSLNIGGLSTYSGTTTIDSGAFLLVSDTGSISNSSNIIDSGTFDISGTTAGTSITTLSGSGTVALGSQTLTITDGSTTFSGVLKDGGISAPSATGGSLTIAGGTETLTGTNTYTGGTTVTAGELIVGNSSALGIGAIKLNPGTTLGFAGGNFTIANAITISGDPTFDVASGTSQTVSSVIANGGTPGTLVLTGGGTLTLTNTNTYTGPTDINGGTLNVTGSIASSSGVTVNSGGTLTGTGKVGATTVASGGTLSPGNAAKPYGTLTVAGNTTFQAGSTLDANVSPSGLSSQLGGAGKTIIDGGTVLAVETPGTYAPITRYVIVDTTGGVAGTFTGSTSALPNFAPSLIYGPDTVTLQLLQTNVPFGTTYGVTPNEISTGQGITAAGWTSGIYTAAAEVATNTPSEMPALLDSLSGEIHASLLSAMIEDSRMIRDSVLDRLADADAQGAVLWGTGFGDFGHIGGDGNAASVRRRDNGGIVGVDAGFDGNLRAGFAAAFTDQTVDVPARASAANGTTDHFVVYGKWTGDTILLSLGIDHGSGANSVTRDVGLLSETERDHQSNAVNQIFGEAGVPFATSLGAIEPYGDLVWVEAHAGSFAETGGIAVLDGNGKGQHEDYTVLGLRAALTQFSILGASVTPRVTAAWQHALSNVTPTGAFAFAGATQSFTIAGAPLAKNAADIGAGVDIALLPGLVFSVGYDGQLSNTVQSNAVDGRISWTF